MSNVYPLPTMRDPERMVCADCGADSSCSCGARSVKAWARSAALAAIAANPERSDRMIAEEIGVGHATVSRARNVSCETISKNGRKRGRRHGEAAAPKIRAALADQSRTIDGIAKEFGVTPKYVAELSGARGHRVGMNRKQAAKALRSFNKAMSYIFNTCEHMSEVAIPPLNVSEKAAALKRLDETRATLRKFSKRIEGARYE